MILRFLVILFEWHALIISHCIQCLNSLYTTRSLKSVPCAFIHVKLLFVASFSKVLQTCDISHIEQQQKQAKQAVKQSKAGTPIEYRQTSTQPKSRQKRQDIQPSQHPETLSQRTSRSSSVGSTVPIQGMRSNQVKTVSTVGKKKGGKLEYSVTDFIHDIETIYFTPRQHKFWMYYQNVNSEPSFKDVMSVSVGSIRSSDYISGRNVLWSYHRDDHSLPSVTNYKLVK